MKIYQNFLAKLPPNFRPVLPLTGAVLIQITLGTQFTIGNMNPYLASYFGTDDSQTVTYDEMTWFLSCMIAGLGVTMMLGGWLDRRYGPRITCAIGCFISTAGVLLTRITIKISFAPCILTYAMMFGLGAGIAYAPPMVCGIKWLPNRRGLAIGIVMAGYGGGAFIFNQVQTYYINPENKKPELQKGHDKYFDDIEILNKVPNMFLILGFSYAALQIVGCLLLENPPKKMPEKAEKPQEKEKENNQNVHSDSDIPALKALKTSTFILLWFAFLFGGQATIMISTFYKSFGQTFISDDNFLAWTGSFASVFNAGGRLAWGHFGDVFSFQSASAVLCCFFTILMLTFPATVEAGKAMFFIWVCAAFGTFSGLYTLYPTVFAKAFGPGHVGIIYGLSFTSQIISMVGGAILASKLKGLVGYNGVWFFVAGCLFISFLLIACLTKTKYGKKRQSKIQSEEQINNEQIIIEEL